MANPFDFATDPNKESRGVWFPWQKGIEFLIKSADCPDYQRAFRKAIRIHKHKLKADALDDATIAKIQARLIADHLLLDWRNVDDEQGAPIAFSPDVAEKFLADPRLRTLSKFILECATDEASYLAEVREAIKGN